MKKLLATVAAVALSFAMVAFPAITATADEVDPTVVTETVVTETVPETTVPETTVPETTVPETTVPETTEPETTEPETTVTETTDPETTEPETTVTETTDPETTEPEVTEPGTTELPGPFETQLLRSLDGLTTVSVELIEVDVDAEATDETCEPAEDDLPGELVPGSIKLTVSDINGIDSIQYRLEGDVSYTNVDLNTLEILNLEPGTYEFLVTVVAGYETNDDEFTVKVKEDNSPDCKKVTICHWNFGQGNQGSYLEIDVSVQSIVNPNGHATHQYDIIPPFDYDGGSYPGLNYPGPEGCGDLTTEGPVIPEVVFTPATCDADGSFTLISPAESEDVPPNTVTWFVNDVETAPGTHPVDVGDTITVKVVANFVTHPIDIGGSFYTEYTYPPYEFTAPVGCDLTTLALTGAGDSTPALALTAFLGLLGLAMVRSGARINRNRQQA